MALCTDCGAQAYYTVSGNTDTFTFPFQYTEPGDVNVALLDRTTGEYVDLDRSKWTFENLTTIKLATPPQVDIVIYRCTDVSQPAATFYPGNPIKAEDLNANQEQVLNAIEELKCAIAACCTGGTPGGGPGVGEPCDDGVCQPGLICVDGICLPVCDDGVCPIGYECVEGICLPICNDTSDCPGEFECVEGICLPPCDDGECPSGFECVEGICLPECDDGECPDGFTCTGGICLPDCSDDGICPEGFVCVDGTCLPDCSDDGVCPEGFICVDGVCTPPDDSDAPDDGKFYGRQSGVWNLATYADFTKIQAIGDFTDQIENPVTRGLDIEQDAPYDSKTYGRVNRTWDEALIYADQLLQIPGSQGTGCADGQGADTGGYCVTQTCDSFIWDCYPDSIQVCAGGCYDAYASTHGCDQDCGPIGLKYKWEQKNGNDWTVIQDWSRNVRYTFETDGLNVGDSLIARITAKCEDFPGGEVELVGDEFTVSIIECGLTDSTPPSPPNGELVISEAPLDDLMYGRRVGDWNLIIQHNISAYPLLPQVGN